MLALAKDGDWLGSWGVVGQGDGEIDKPSGIAIDREDNIYYISNGRLPTARIEAAYRHKFGKMAA